MNNAALARQLEAELIPPALQTTYKPSHVSVPLPPRAAPRGALRRLWLRLFGPPAIDARSATTDFGAFRALYEIGSDHLPSSGTWPAARK